MIKFDSINELLNPAFMTLVGFLLVISCVPWELIPWERLSSFKAGEVALNFEQPKIKTAISGIFDYEDLDYEDKKRIHVNGATIKDVLMEYSYALEFVAGSNILWIDDKPFRNVTQKRLLRALGANIVSTVSSNDASQILHETNDFDLIITNVNRNKNCQEGGLFIVKLKLTEDEVIKSLPVIFFSAHPDAFKLTRVACAISVGTDTPVPHVCHKTQDLLRFVFEELSKRRSRPLIIPSEKEIIY